MADGRLPDWRYCWPGRWRSCIGAALPGAKVMLTETDRNVAHPAIADEAGRYFVTALPPGSYTLSVEAQGFKKYTQIDIPLAALKRRFALDYDRNPDTGLPEEAGRPGARRRCQA